MPHMAMGMKVAMNVHFDDKIPQPARTALHDAINETGNAKDGQKGEPEPQNEENLQRNQI